MEFRLATNKDIPEIENIFYIAKQRMRKEGNLHQWTEVDYPISYTKKDIENNNCYLLINDMGIIDAVFTFIIGIEPTYIVIEGSWKNVNPYGTIHRIAVRQDNQHYFHIIIDYLKTFKVDIKTDTHVDNHHMKYVIEKEGFQYCGIIYIRDGTPRLAYQLINK